MKTIIILFALTVAACASAQTIAWATNFPAATLTVSAPDKLKVSGRPLELYFTSSDFVLSNGTVRLAAKPYTSYPSNTWNLAVITNGQLNGEIRTTPSNGVTLVDVWMSNGVPVLKPHW